MPPGKNEKTNVMRILEQKGIPYTPHFYDHSDGQIDAAAVAGKLCQPMERVFKTLVTRGSGRGVFVFVLPASQELDLKAAARAVGEKAVEMVRVSEINGLTGYIRGGCSPIGMKKLFPTVFDSSCLSFPTIMVSAGKIGAQVEAPPAALISLTQGKTAPIGCKGET